MKKIVTLLMVTMLTTSMLALEKITFPLTKQGDDVSKVVLSKRQDIRKHTSVSPVKADTPVRRYGMPIKQQTSTDAIILNGEGFLVGPEYDAETSEWYIALEAQGYTFRLCWYGNEESYCGEYTFDDISWDWTWGWYQSSNSFYEIYLSDITMSISEKQVGNYLKQIILDATLVDDQDNTYELHAVHNMYIPKSTVYNLIEEAEVSMYDGGYTLDGNNADMDILLSVKSNAVDGFYTHKDFEAGMTRIEYKGVKQDILQATLNVVGGYMEDGSLSYEAELSFFNQDTVQHIVYLSAPLPAVHDTIRVSCNNLEIDESFAAFGMMLVTGSSDEYDVIAMYEGTRAEEGVYKNVRLTIADKVTWMEQPAIYATLTLTQGTDGWEANIEAYGSDYNWYSIDMKYIVPEPTKTVKISFEEPAIATFRPDQFNMIQLLHENTSADYDASLTIYSIGLGEEFGRDNVLMDYSGIYDKLAQRSVLMADVKGVLNQRGDTTVINVSVIGWDAVQYDIELWYAVPEPVRTVELEMPVEFINRMQDGYYTLGAYTPDSTWYVSFSPMTSEVAGTFVNDGLFGQFGEGHYDFMGGDTYVYSSKEMRPYTVEKGTLVVTHTPDGVIIAEANVICSNAIYYHIKMTSEYNTHLDYDEPEEEVDRTYTTDDVVFIEDQIADNGYIFLQLIAADESDEAQFFFYSEEVDEDITIPVGTYTIDYTEDYGTVQANPGVQGIGVWPSFYALKAEGGYAVPLWLLVSGTVEVSKDEDGNPHLEVNAVNSYGVEVHIVYDGTTTGFENVKFNADGIRKQIVDGQLLIKRDGKTYNALGTQVQ